MHTRSGIFAARLRAWRVARGVDLPPREQAHSAARNEGPKARSAAVSFARSGKEGKTADLGHGNGNGLDLCEWRAIAAVAGCIRPKAEIGAWAKQSVVPAERSVKLPTDAPLHE